MTIGQQIRIERIKQGYNIKELSDKVDTNHVHLGRVELGKSNPSYELIKRIKEVLKCDFVI